MMGGKNALAKVFCFLKMTRFVAPEHLFGVPESN
jgi:hypothetical protein